MGASKEGKSQKITISHVGNPDGPSRFCVYVYTYLSVCIHVHTYIYIFFSHTKICIMPYFVAVWFSHPSNDLLVVPPF